MLVQIYHKNPASVYPYSYVIRIPQFTREGALAENNETVRALYLFTKRGNLFAVLKTAVSFGVPSSVKQNGIAFTVLRKEGLQLFRNNRGRKQNTDGIDKFDIFCGKLLTKNVDQGLIFYAGICVDADRFDSVFKQCENTFGNGFDTVRQIFSYRGRNTNAVDGIRIRIRIRVEHKAHFKLPAFVYSLRSLFCVRRQIYRFLTLPHLSTDKTSYFDCMPFVSMLCATVDAICFPFS